jgi:hypothetical protein
MIKSNEVGKNEHNSFNRLMAQLPNVLIRLDESRLTRKRCLDNVDYEWISCSTSHPAQLPEHGEGVESHSCWAISSRASCTAHFIPRRCISALVEISESSGCPLINCVSDMPTIKKAMATTQHPTTIRIVIRLVCMAENYLNFLELANL